MVIPIKVGDPVKYFTDDDVVREAVVTQLESLEAGCCRGNCVDFIDLAHSHVVIFTDEDDMVFDYQFFEVAGKKIYYDEGTDRIKILTIH